MSVNLSPLGGAGAQFFTNNGVPLAGGLLYTYQAGTTTPATTYSSSNGLTALANPIVLDAGGRVPTGEVWLSDGSSYKFVLKDSNDALIATWDGLSGINSNFIAYTSLEETATATAGQTVFNLTLDYIVGANSLAVFVNGSNQIVNVNYLETDTNTVTFLTGLNVGDVVKFNTATPVATNAMDAANVSYTPAGAGAVTMSVQAKLRESVSVKDFGAVGDGVTDDATAIANAESEAYQLGATLIFPFGTYLTSVAQVYRCSVIGYSATIKNSSSTEVVSSNGAIVRAGAGNISFTGLTVDGNSAATGFQNNGFDHVAYSECVAISCLNTGFIAFNAIQGSYTNCRVDGVIYAAAGLIQADGFYAGACDDFSYLNCIAENFERIGFVSEGDAGTDSNRPRYVSCVAKNASNCDRSVAEYNAGFWCENTNGAFLDNVSCLNISSGVGQTSNRVVGVTLNGNGNSTASVNTLSNFIIGENTATILTGISFSSSLATMSIVIENGYVTNYKKGITPNNSYDSITVKNVTFADGVYTTNGTGGLICDTVTVNQITLDNIREINPTYTNDDAATFNWYANGSGDKNVTISNCKKITVSTVLGLGNVTLSDSYIYKRSTNKDLIGQTGELLVTNCIIEQLSGNTGIFNGANSGNSAETLVSNSKFINVASFNTYKGLRLSFSSCMFSESMLDWNTNLNNCLLKVNNCTWKNTSLACIRTQFYNNTNDTFIAQNNTFLTGATVAILLRTYSPDYVILQGNTYNNTTLTDLTTTSAVNNITTP